MSCVLPTRRFPVEEIPDDEKDCAEWLHKLYQEKVRFFLMPNWGSGPQSVHTPPQWFYWLYLYLHLIHYEWTAIKRPAPYFPEASALSSEHFFHVHIYTYIYMTLGWRKRFRWVSKGSIKVNLQRSCCSHMLSKRSGLYVSKIKWIGVWEGWARH